MGTTLDLFATKMALAGAKIYVQTDGFDLSRVLLGSSSGLRDTMAYYRSGELRAFRKGQFKLHLITSGAYGQSPERVEHASGLLFHLGEDPGERFDVADRYPQVVAELKAEIARHQAAVPAAVPLFDRRLRQAPTAAVQESSAAGDP